MEVIGGEVAGVKGRPEHPQEEGSNDREGGVCPALLEGFGGPNFAANDHCEGEPEESAESVDGCGSSCI